MGSAVLCRIRNATECNGRVLAWIPFDGGIIVAAYISCQRQLEL